MLDVPEVRHAELNVVLQRATHAAVAYQSQVNSCLNKGCDCDCEQCEKAMMTAQEARRDVLRYVDEHYQRFSL